MNQDDAVADHLLRQQLLDQLSNTQFQGREAIRQRFAREDEAQLSDQAGTKSGPSRDQVATKSGLSPEQRIVLAQMSDEHDIHALMEWVWRSNRSKFREAVLLAWEHVEMTISHKPNSSKQRECVVEGRLASTVSARGGV